MLNSTDQDNLIRAFGDLLDAIGALTNPNELDGRGIDEDDLMNILDVRLMILDKGR